MSHGWLLPATSREGDVVLHHTPDRVTHLRDPRLRLSVDPFHRAVLSAPRPNSQGA